MCLRVLLLWLGIIGIGYGEDGGLLPQAAGDELSRLAEALLGKRAGNQLFYFPTHDVPATPKDWGLKYEEVNFQSKDGTHLHAWFLPAQHKPAKATVVFSHGNAGSIGHHLGFVMWFAEAGYNVLTYDYRGFGASGGTVDRRGMLDDVRAAFDYVSKRPDIDTGRLVSYGHSLGGAKSLAALGEGSVKGLRAVITDGAFSSYLAMAKIMAGQVGAKLVTDEWAPVDAIWKISPVPLLIVHGTKDELVPIAQGRLLFKTAGEPKTLFEVKDGHHGDSLVCNHGAYRKKLLAWLDAALKG
ncbi:MAG: alpha/beta fold hydrolase [Verrucomicrobia bacterium]|nr:MAG: alpha/beta fold hydrolase [Verrucomicrobiota bacterium]